MQFTRVSSRRSWRQNGISVRYRPGSPTVYRRLNIEGSFPGSGAGRMNSAWAEKSLGTMIAFTPFHSTVSLLRPEVCTSRRVMPAGITIGLPPGIKSSQCMLGENFDGVEMTWDTGTVSDGQQKCVLPSSEAAAGTERLETNDCFDAGLFVGAKGAATSETR